MREPAYDENGVSIWCGDALEVLREMPDESVHCCVTSPPYWGLRDYKIAGQLGKEKTPEEYVARVVGVFAEVRRVLRPDGTLWFNVGDSYASTGGHSDTHCNDRRGQRNIYTRPEHEYRDFRIRGKEGLKPKDLVGVPWMLAFALRADGWYLRQDIIWSKPNPMPESVSDRCTKAHEYIFLLSKSRQYYFNADAIKETVSGTAHARGDGVNPKAMKMPDGWDTGAGGHGPFHRNGREKGKTRPRQNPSFSAAVNELVDNRNKRSVWTVATEACPEAHFATFPTELIKPCILAGCPAGGIVLDPFGGSGTTGEVARALHCQARLIELNPGYIEIAKRRLRQNVLLFTEPEPVEERQADPPMRTISEVYGDIEVK